MKKTFVAGALAFTMAAAFLSGCGSNIQTKAANRLEEIQQRGYIEVATEPYFAPNEFIDSDRMSSMWEVILRWRNTSQINLVWS